MKELNKYKDIIINHYTTYCNEDERLLTKKSHLIEYLTTMRYIEKYAKSKCKILEIGAATGVYSVELAKKGYNVMAVDLVPENIAVLKEKSKGLNNIVSMVGDAMDLSAFNDNEFDVVLNLGPMYHLYNQKDKDKAISETIRVCKPNGICMFAYLTHSSIVWNYGIRKNKMEDLSKCLKADGRIIDKPEEVFSSYFIEDFKRQFDNTGTEYITNVATDGLSEIMRDYINDIISDEDYERFVKWHFATCERLDHQGISSHLLYICKKTNNKKISKKSRKN